MTFALDCCDREAMSWVATTGGYSGDVVRHVMLAAVEQRFGNVPKAPEQIEWLTDNGLRLHCREDSRVRHGHWPETADDAGMQPAE